MRTRTWVHRRHYTLPSSSRHGVVSPSKAEPKLGPALRLKYMWSLPREGSPESLSLRKGGQLANLRETTFQKLDVRGPQSVYPHARTKREAPGKTRVQSTPPVSRTNERDPGQKPEAQNTPPPSILREERKRNLNRVSQTVNTLRPAGPLKAKATAAAPQSKYVDLVGAVVSFSSSLFKGTHRFSYNFFSPFLFI